ncbi:MAG: PEP-CTERM sorting domain-containing protein, partial [Myxococcales bacterium]|nr:PEP-CTERM sorting domain-containing protein [Myxococcales bacterium]
LVPEPGTGALAALGVAGLALRRSGCGASRRRRGRA